MLILFGDTKYHHPIIYFALGSLTFSGICLLLVPSPKALLKEGRQKIREFRLLAEAKKEKYLH